MPTLQHDAVHGHAREYNIAAVRAEFVANTGRSLRDLGFVPDIIIGHHGWGELLDLVDVWPGVPILGYFEFYYSPFGQDVNFDPEFPIAETQFARIRAMNIINLLALSLDQHGQTPTQYQLTRYPDWAQAKIRVLPEGAQLDVCKPDPAMRKAPLAIGDFKINPKDKLVTFVARNLEPYRGYHIMMRALVPLLRARKDVKVVMIGGDDVSYGARLEGSTWKLFMEKELHGQYDATRVLMPGQVPYEQYVQLLQRADTHVYLTYPFVASWSLREALACGCAIVGADVEPVSEFITHGQNGLLTPGLDSARLSDTVLTLLEDTKLNKRLRTGARAYAEQHLDMATHIAAFEARIEELTGQKP
jgi:glycosyltransferase involved in cell wall biosynthesis